MSCRMPSASLKLWACCPTLDIVGLRTRRLTYYTRSGQEVWSELRGTYAGHEVPQFSIHRGRLQNLLYKAVLDRLGPKAVQTGRRLSVDLFKTTRAVTAHFANSIDGSTGITVRGDVLICCDGIHSAGRKVFYPNEKSPSWNGVMMWRGAVDWPAWQDGESMAIGGGLGGKFVLYPITQAKDGRQLDELGGQCARQRPCCFAAAREQLVAQSITGLGFAACAAVQCSGF